MVLRTGRIRHLTDDDREELVALVTETLLNATLGHCGLCIVSWGLHKLYGYPGTLRIGAIHLDSLSEHEYRKPLGESDASIIGIHVRWLKWPLNTPKTKRWPQDSSSYFVSSDFPVDIQNILSMLG